MLKKVHYYIDARSIKCCFSSTMNLTSYIVTELGRQIGKYGWAACGLAGALYLSSCATGPISSGPYKNETGAAESLSKPKAAENARSDGQAANSTSAEPFAKPAKERPGLATAWGDSVNSPMTEMRFSRASSEPAGVDAIFYNNREGLEAMGAMGTRVEGMQQAAGGIVEWGVKGGIGLLPAYKSWSSGGYRRFVQGSNGSTYSIVIKNSCKCRVQVVLSVDGLDVIDGKPASKTRPGYVIESGKTMEVRGFRTSYSTVAAFKFSSVSQSYANLRHGDTRNVGVIGLAVYTEKGADPWTWMPAEMQKRETANPFATQPQ